MLCYVERIPEQEEKISLIKGQVGNSGTAAHQDQWSAVGVVCACVCKGVCVRVCVQMVFAHSKQYRRILRCRINIRHL